MHEARSARNHHVLLIALMIDNALPAGQARSSTQSQARGRGQPGRVRGRWPEHTSHTEAAGARDSVAYVCRTRTCAVYQSRA
jgi:hypothetical protein